MFHTVWQMKREKKKYSPCVRLKILLRHGMEAFTTGLQLSSPLTCIRSFWRTCRHAWQTAASLRYIGITRPWQGCLDSESATPVLFDTGKCVHLWVPVAMLDTYIYISSEVYRAHWHPIWILYHKLYLDTPEPWVKGKEKHNAPCPPLTPWPKHTNLKVKDCTRVNFFRANWVCGICKRTMRIRRRYSDLLHA